MVHACEPGIRPEAEHQVRRFVRGERRCRSTEKCDDACCRWVGRVLISTTVDIVHLGRGWSGRKRNTQEKRH